MSLSSFDLQKLAAVRLKESIRKKGSPNRFGKASSEKKENQTEGKKPTLLSGLLKRAESR